MNTLRSLMVGILMLVALMTVPVIAMAIVDPTPPATAATLTGTMGSDGWYSTSVIVTLAAADEAGGSGVAKTEYSLDNVTWQTYATPLVFDKDGDMYVYFRSTDMAGNVEAPAKSQEIKINKAGLVGWWKMDGDWTDASVGGNNGTPVNGATFSPNAKIGTQAGIFDGMNDYATVLHNNMLNPSSSQTIAFWIYFNSLPNAPKDIIQKGIGTANAQYYIRTNSAGGLDFGFRNTVYTYVFDSSLAPYTTSFASLGITVGSWQHIAFVVDDATHTAYVYANGVQKTTVTGAFRPVGQGDSALTIGGSAWDGYFNGLIDDVSIYNRALSATNIQGLYRDFVVRVPTVDPAPSLTAAETITLSGTKEANTAIVVNGSTLVPLDATTSWQTGYTLSPGMNTVNVTALDSQKFSSLSVALTVVLDTTPPVAPTINPLSAQINTTSKTITGTKSSDSVTVVVNCAGAIGALSYPTDTTWSVDVSGLREGSNTITAYAIDVVGNRSATATATITVDTTPPVVGATPAGGIYKSAQSVTLGANEPTAIYYTLDGSTPTVSSTRYSQPITIPAGVTLKYFGKDLAGNASEIKTENYVVDTVPPVLAISTLSNGTYTNNETLNIAGTVTDDTGVKEITVNDTAVPLNADGSFSFALLLKTGANSITIAATDNAGNKAMDIRAVTLDQTVPVLAVTTPADNSKTAKMLLDVSGTVDETSTVTVKWKDIVQSALMNDGAFTATIILEPGYNTIEITAVDLAGNQSSLKRTVVLDDQVPSLAVTVPSQDIRTNQRSLTIKGTVSDPLTTVGVTLSKDNEIITLPVIDGTFEQTVNFTEEKTYGIVVTATNEVGTTASIQRNVIYDITPPALSIDPLPVSTGQPSLSVSGIREAGAEVIVTCTTATVGEISYPTATTWQVDIFGLTEGENVIAAASFDAAGNAVTATATVAYSSRPPEITLTATPNVIWPPNHEMVPVKITGGVEVYGSEIKSISIAVVDEYGKIKYKNLKFGSTVMLEAWRNGNDMDGRKYTIIVVVTKRDGSTIAKTATVTVPHDMLSGKAVREIGKGRRW